MLDEMIGRYSCGQNGNRGVENYIDGWHEVRTAEELWPPRAAASHFSHTDEADQREEKRLKPVIGIGQSPYLLVALQGPRKMQINRRRERERSVHVRASYEGLALKGRASTTDGIPF